MRTLVFRLGRPAWFLAFVVWPAESSSPLATDPAGGCQVNANSGISDEILASHDKLVKVDGPLPQEEEHTLSIKTSDLATRFTNEGCSDEVELDFADSQSADISNDAMTDGTEGVSTDPIQANLKVSDLFDIDQMDRKLEDANPSTSTSISNHTSTFVPESGPYVSNVEILPNDSVGSDRSSYVTRSDFWEAFDCDSVFQGTRPVHNVSTWAFLRGIYLGVVGRDRSTLLDSPYSQDGFQKAIVVKQSPGKGRGLFANEFISKGELIWLTTQEARFQSGDLYRQFLAAIPDDLVCDVMQLTYIQETEEILLEQYPDLYSEYMIAVDLDEGGLVNADWEFDGDIQNIGFYRDLDDADEDHPWYTSSQHYVALTGIQAGEELLSNYDDVTEDEWSNFGL